MLQPHRESWCCWTPPHWHHLAYTTKQCRAQHSLLLTGISKLNRGKLNKPSCCKAGQRCRGSFSIVTQRCFQQTGEKTGRRHSQLMHLRWTHCTQSTYHHKQDKSALTVIQPVKRAWVRARAGASAGYPAEQEGALVRHQEKNASDLSFVGDFQHSSRAVRGAVGTRWQGDQGLRWVFRG